MNDHKKEANRDLFEKYLHNKTNAHLKTDDFYQLFEPPWVTFLRFFEQDKDREKMGNCIMTEIHYEDYDIRKGKALTVRDFLSQALLRSSNLEHL